jgi:hypothetical protein
MEPNYPDVKTPYTTITVKDAHALAKRYGKIITIATLIKWIDEHEPKLGHQPGGNGGQWYIFKEPFTLFISGQESLCNEMLLTMATNKEA